MNTQAISKPPGTRSKVIDHSKWVSDLKPRPVMVNDEIPSEHVNFADEAVLTAVIQQFKKAGMCADREASK